MNVKLGPEVFNRAAIKIKVAFEEKSFKANQTVGLSVYLRNNVPGKVFFFFFKKTRQIIFFVNFFEIWRVLIG